MSLTEQRLQSCNGEVPHGSVVIALRRLGYATLRVLFTPQRELTKGVPSDIRILSEGPIHGETHATMEGAYNSLLKILGSRHKDTKNPMFIRDTVRITTSASEPGYTAWLRIGEYTHI